MGRIRDFISRILFKMFPQKEPSLPTDERYAYEFGGRIFRGIKGNKDKSRIVHGMAKRNMGH